ncbi:potassium-transporting ATPase subunit KdpC [Xanthomonas sp. WHRI 8391]|uniref:Potassium-transporting ATPase KdpC subunit n=1 Tax=Xanthomonas hortorum pv. carotae TaxID=487904 RepID=A0A6V7FEI2_9XANT|nr:potassium-transporting ATPase subunit KdpC [Xanthomonas hortorum]ETC89595.1 Potassium-transporting ATPase C chain [Xanthomonas hortorum pv. carotae str. M081]MBG3849138.1 potassium-transporting ATPase subunit KdpC [Xanthomonas hortorum pv. carotae]UTS75143.1 potassium-transporting ATPase subunit KdpC [Xanthomonas hortorum]CAD0361778.1 Potassium-transporting ATPase KdpC subunit [Xanthomonas hortorum pv. carotae]CAD0361779.1 Potassium-transporting ATPase KdpC subunit [Xanthomonas hortorum pv.
MTISSNTNLSTSLPLRDDGALRGSVMLALFILLGLGLSYSLIATGITGALFPAQAHGSLLRVDARVVGSALVAQPFADARYFQPRLSAAKYDPTAAAGSNQARSNPDLQARIAATRAEVAARDGIAPGAVPSELLTQSGSGLDPHLSPAAVQVQLRRVANARGWPEQRVAALVQAATEHPQFGLLGQPRVNVLSLNLALDAAGNRKSGIENGARQQR